jgi:hypothetical protein
MIVSGVSTLYEGGVAYHTAWGGTVFAPTTIVIGVLSIVAGIVLHRRRLKSSDLVTPDPFSFDLYNSPQGSSRPTVPTSNANSASASSVETSDNVLVFRPRCPSGEVPPASRDKAPEE